MTEVEKTAAEIVEIAAAAASDKKAQQIVIMEMQKVSPITDYFLIASGTSMTQVQAIADSIEEKLEEAGQPFLHKEGYREGRWVLLDYGVFVAHIFVNEERQFYNLEQLWSSAPLRAYVD
jgi:ribosome-associated protein